MMRLGRRATLLIAFFLLTSAATAHAECAWVLWRNTNTILGSATSESWQIADASNTKAECDLVIEQMLVRYRNKPSDSLADYGVDGGTVILKFKNGGTGMMTYNCLPDTVDPRGAKGK
jgi:hypothetical protein